MIVNWLSHQCGGEQDPGNLLFCDSTSSPLFFSKCCTQLDFFPTKILFSQWQEHSVVITFESLHCRVLDHPGNWLLGKSCLFPLILSLTLQFLLLEGYDCAMENSYQQTKNKWLQTKGLVLVCNVFNQ